MAERPMAAYQTAIATLIGSGLTNTAITGLDMASSALANSGNAAPDAQGGPTEAVDPEVTPEAPPSEEAPQEPAAAQEAPAQEAAPEAEADTFEAQAQRMQDAVDAAAAEVGATSELDQIIEKNPDVQGMGQDTSAADAFEAEYNALLGLGPKQATVEQPAAPAQEPATPGPQATPFRAIFGEQAPPSIVEQAQVQELSAATEATSKKYFGRKSFGGRGLNQTETQAEATPQVAQDATPVVDEAPALLTDDQITRIADRETVKAPEAADAESMLTLAEQNYDEVSARTC